MVHLYRLSNFTCRNNSYLHADTTHTKEKGLVAGSLNSLVAVSYLGIQFTRFF